MTDTEKMIARSSVTIAPHLFFDIETVANPKAVKMLPEPTPPKNLKDPHKIEAKIAQLKKDQIAKAALDPDTALVKAIGWRWGVHGEDIIKVIKPTKAKERALIVSFWDALKLSRGLSVGYNIIGFDYPVLLRRSMELGIKPNIFPDMSPYALSSTYDLMYVMYGKPVPKGKTQKWMAYRYGIDQNFDDRSGGDVASMSDDEIALYLGDDIRRNVESWILMNGVYWPEIDYR